MPTSKIDPALPATKAPARPTLDPALQRGATEALAHTGRARRLIAELAKTRGSAVPPAPTVHGFAPGDLDEYSEVTRAVIREELNAARAQQKTVPDSGHPSGRAALLVEWGRHRLGVHDWRLAAFLLLLLAGLALSWIRSRQPAPSPPAPARSTVAQPSQERPLVARPEASVRYAHEPVVR